jgi:hypothetical protein
MMRRKYAKPSRKASIFDGWRFAFWTSAAQALYSFEDQWRRPEAANAV